MPSNIPSSRCASLFTRGYCIFSADSEHLPLSGNAWPWLIGLPTTQPPNGQVIPLCRKHRTQTRIYRTAYEFRWQSSRQHTDTTHKHSANSFCLHFAALSKAQSPGCMRVHVLEIATAHSHSALTQKRNPQDRCGPPAGSSKLRLPLKIQNEARRPPAALGSKNSDETGRAVGTTCQGTCRSEITSALRVSGPEMSHIRGVGARRGQPCGPAIECEHCADRPTFGVRRRAVMEHFYSCTASRYAQCASHGVAMTSMCRDTLHGTLTWVRTDRAPMQQNHLNIDQTASRRGVRMPIAHASLPRRNVDNGAADRRATDLSFHQCVCLHQGRQCTGFWRPMIRNFH